MINAKNRFLIIGVYFLLAVVTLAVYWQVIGHEFVNYDDGDYILKNLHVKSGLSVENVKWAFTKGYAANWHPLTWLSHMLDCQLFGLDAGMHHLTSLVIHIVSSLLLLFLLSRVTRIHNPAISREKSSTD